MTVEIQTFALMTMYWWKFHQLTACCRLICCFRTHTCISTIIYFRRADQILQVQHYTNALAFTLDFILVIHLVPLVNRKTLLNEHVVKINNKLFALNDGNKNSFFLHHKLKLRNVVICLV